MGLYFIVTIMHSRPYSKSKLELESNFSEFCQLIASLSVILPQLNLIKLKLEYRSLAFSAKKDINIDEKIFASLEFDFFFEFSSSLLLEYGCLSKCTTIGGDSFSSLKEEYFFRSYYYFSRCFRTKLTLKHTLQTSYMIPKKKGFNL